MSIEKTSGSEEKVSGKKIVVFTQNGTVNEKLQKAGYLVHEAKQLSMLGAKEFKLVGTVPLKIEALNEEIAKNCRSHQRGRQLIEKLTMTEADLELIYKESVNPSPEVLDMKAQMAEAAAKRKKKKKKK